MEGPKSEDRLSHQRLLAKKCSCYEVCRPSYKIRDEAVHIEIEAEIREKEQSNIPTVCQQRVKYAAVSCGCVKQGRAVPHFQTCDEEEKGLAAHGEAPAYIKVPLLVPSGDGVLS